MKYLLLILLLIPSVMATGYAEWYNPIPDDSWNRTISINYTFLEPTFVEKIQFNVWNETHKRPKSLFLEVDEALIFNGDILWVTDNIGLIDVNYTGTKYSIYITDSYNATHLRIDEVLYLQEPTTWFNFEYNTNNLVIVLVIVILLAISGFIGAIHGLNALRLFSAFAMIVIGIMLMVSGWNFFIALILMVLPLIFLFETG